MSQPADNYAARLGTHSDWGLTRESFTPLRDELADHLHCLADESGRDQHNANPRAGGTGVAPVELAAKLTAPKARRALTATRIADQVYATLHRWPTKQEWREFAWLLFWYGLMIASDLLAGRANTNPELALHAIQEKIYRPDNPEAAYLWGAWLLQGVARAGFFAAFGLSLYRSYRVGTGVLIARLLQLKLVHVVLVVIAGLAFGSLIYGPGSRWSGVAHYTYLSGPAWLTAPLISVSLMAIAVALFCLRRYRLYASGLILAALFLYPGGPIASHQLTVKDQWIKQGFFKLSDGTLRPEGTRKRMNPTTGIITEYSPESLGGKKVVATLPNTFELRRQYFEELPEWRKEMYAQVIDLEANSQSFSWEELSHHPIYHLRTWRDGRHSNLPYYTEGSLSGTVSSSAPRLQGPLSASGAGIGWLAAPIPILTLVGLLLLIGIMGRRGVVAFVAYVLLAGAAMILTITPFFIGRREFDIFEFGPQGFINSPFPGFESLMIVSWQELMQTDHSYFTLILGLILSSGVPWLLTALFLKPDNQPQQTSGPELAA